MPAQSQRTAACGGYTEGAAYRRECLPELGLPLVEDLEELRSLRVADTAFQDPLCAAFGEDVVDELGDALERPDPVAVPAAEDGVLNVLELAALQALDPLDEMSGVVCGLACPNVLE